MMIDLETLGTRPNAPVIAIGAAFFDPDTGEIGKTFDGAIDFEDACRFGQVEGSTIKWWFGQSDEARSKAVRGTASAEKVFRGFANFVRAFGDPAKVQPWGNGASFDISIMDYAFRRILNEQAPWSFWNVRDCRTIKEIATGFAPDYKAARKGVHHSALDDAIYQAEWVSYYWQHLRMGVCASTVLDI
jgi:oligoribonuclease (3'-5' exoribonuclease)